MTALRSDEASAGSATPLLFSPIRLRDLEFRNRAWVAPMCQYSASEGVPDDWHLAHLGSFARGGMGLVLTEATAVAPNGRISPADTGIWNAEQTAAWARITAFVRSQGAAVGIQLAHAGRKASTQPPWLGGGHVAVAQGGWADVVAPSAIAFGALPEPRPLSRAEIGRVVEEFAEATRNALRAGFDVIEVHAAHGYLLHSFLSPLSNHRDDEYGGSFDNRARMVLEVVDAVRAEWPENRPLLVRLSATDWVEGGWDVDQSVRLSRQLVAHGVDLVDCSSGGIAADAVVPAAPGYQVPFAARIRREASVPTAAVGLITEPRQAEDVIARGDADVVLLGRELLRSPHWALSAAAELGGEAPWPNQYLRARRA